MSIALVTGGAGFIGSNLAEDLLKKGYEVKVIDNFITGKKENLKNILSDIDLITGDIRDYDLVLNTSKGCDVIFHQAALPSVQRSIRHPLETNEVNINGTINLLKAAVENNVSRFISASSSSVYGDSEVLPKVETMEPNPKSPYAVTKMTGEYYCNVYYNIYGLETISLRYFNVFGNNQDPYSEYSAVIPKFIYSLLKNEPVTIHGDGNQTRDFTYIENVVKLNIQCVHANDPKVFGQVFNIACGQRITINELFATLKNALNSNLDPIYSEPRVGDISDSIANIDKAKQLLNYAPDTNLNHQLQFLVEQYQSSFNETI